MKTKYFIMALLMFVFLSFTYSSGTRNVKPENLREKAIVFEWDGKPVLTIIYKTKE